MLFSDLISMITFYNNPGNIQFLFFVEFIDDIIISPSGSSNVKSFITSIPSY